MAKVVFLQNIRGVAQIGDIKEVADGYARNFLLPRKMAVLANKNALKIAEGLKQKRETENIKGLESAKKLVEKFKDFVLTIERSANEEGTLYDGLDSAEISGYLKKQGIGLEPEQILLTAPIKKIGEHQATLDLGEKVEGLLQIKVKRIEE